MIHIRVIPMEVGIGTHSETGNPQVTAIDKTNNIAVSIEFSPDAWKQFVQNAPRLTGIGIPTAGRVPIFTPDGER